MNLLNPSCPTEKYNIIMIKLYLKKPTNIKPSFFKIYQSLLLNKLLKPLVNELELKAIMRVKQTKQLFKQY